MLRKTPLKRGTSTLNSKSKLRGTGMLKKGKGIKSKPVSEDARKQQRIDQEAMWKLFDLHWQIKAHICQACGDPIWGDNLSIYHHHCWPKHRYPEYKYIIEGLMLVCWECHSNIENGNISPETAKKIEKIKFNVT